MEHLGTPSNKVWKIILRVFLIIKKRENKISSMFPRSYIYTVMFHENGVPIVKFCVIMQ